MTEDFKNIHPMQSKHYANFRKYYCPICEDKFEKHPAISRFDNEAMVCSTCGETEAYFDYMNSKYGKPNSILSMTFKQWKEDIKTIQSHLDDY